MDDSKDTTDGVPHAVASLLRDRGLTYEDVEAQTGIPYRTLRRRLAGQGKAFDINELTKIARILDVSLTALITYAEAAEPRDRVAS